MRKHPDKKKMMTQKLLQPSEPISSRWSPTLPETRCMWCMAFFFWFREGPFSTTRGTIRVFRFACYFLCVYGWRQIRWYKHNFRSVVCNKFWRETDNVLDRTSKRTLSTAKRETKPHKSPFRPFSGVRWSGTEVGGFSRKSAWVSNVPRSAKTETVPACYRLQTENHSQIGILGAISRHRKTRDWHSRNLWRCTLWMAWLVEL